MAVDIQFLYRNIVDPNKTYNSTSDFFDSTYTGTTDEETVKLHDNINNKFVHEKHALLTPDKKGVVVIRRFDRVIHYNEWKKERSVLPKIDFNITEQEGFFMKVKEWGDYRPKDGVNLMPTKEEFN